jgi:LacI family transcriptional regulator, gluconate utilization system Gnt-I transcriptional repressor
VLIDGYAGNQGLTSEIVSANIAYIRPLDSPAVIVANPINSSVSSNEVIQPLRRKGHGRVTLREVAELAEVTTMTVSRFLRSPHLVTPSTAERIQEALLNTGYTPNIQAGHLASGRSHVVAVIVPNMSHSIFADTLHGLVIGLEALGLQMLVASSEYSLEQEARHIRAVLGWAPAGLILTGRHHSPSSEKLITQSAQLGIPVIEMWDQRPKAMPAVSQVGFQHGDVGAQMADALHSKGYRQCLFIDSAVQEDFRAHERAQGFMHRAEQLKQACACIPAAPGDPVEAGRRVLIQAMKSHQTAPSKTSLGVACANDMLAVGAWLAAQELGLSLPQQVGILGFGDFPLGRYWAGGLSTVRIDGEQIGRECAILLGQLRQQHLQSKAAWSNSTALQRTIHPELIWRST